MLKLQVHIEDLLLKVFLISGLALSLIQFFTMRSLYLDEAMLSINFVKRDYLGILQPLEYSQVAPVLFLLVEKFLFNLMPSNDLMLRIFPLILYWISLILFYRIILNLFKNKRLQLFSLLLFVFNFHLIYYSSGIKQYMGDVFSLISITYVLFQPEKERKWIILALLGILIIGLSNIAPIILCSSFIYLFIEKDKKTSHAQLYYLASIWACSFLVYYFGFVYGHPSRDFMLTYWRKAYGLMPGFQDDRSIGLFFKIKFITLFRNMLSLGKLDKFIMLGFYLLGIYTLWKTKKKHLCALLFLPIIIHFLLSFLELYPLELRLVLYYTPFLIILSAIGLEYFSEQYLKKQMQKTILVYGLMVFFSISIFQTFQKNFPVDNKELKTLMGNLGQEKYNSSQLLVASAISPSFLFYKMTKFQEQAWSVNYSTSEPHKFTDWKELSRDFKEPFWLIYSSSALHQIDMGLEIQNTEAKILDFRPGLDIEAYLLEWDREIFKEENLKTVII